MSVDFYIFNCSLYPFTQNSNLQSPQPGSNNRVNTLTLCEVHLNAASLSSKLILCRTHRCVGRKDGGTIEKMMGFYLVFYFFYSPISLATAWSLLLHLLTKTMLRPLRASWRKTDGQTGRHFSINTIIRLLTGQDVKGKRKNTERNLERYLGGVSFTNTRCGTSDNYTR